MPRTEVDVACPECGTRTSVALERAREVIDRHNERRHDDEAVADFDESFLERMQKQAQAVLEEGHAR